MNKKCNKCNEYKELSAYSKDKRNTDKLCSSCKVCKDVINKIYRDKNKDKQKEYNIAYKLRKRESAATRAQENRDVARHIAHHDTTVYCESLGGEMLSPDTDYI